MFRVPIVHPNSIHYETLNLFLSGEVGHVKLIVRECASFLKYNTDRSKKSFLLFDQVTKLWRWVSIEEASFWLSTFLSERLEAVVQHEDQHHQELLLLADKFQKLTYCTRLLKESKFRLASSDLSSRLNATVGNRLQEDWIPVREAQMLNLRTRQVRPRTSDELWTFELPVSYLGVDAPTPQADRFLREVSNNDPELDQYLRMMLGYLLTSSNQERSLFYWYGPEGSNGKSTLEELVQLCFGGDGFYASLEAKLVLQRSGPPPNLEKQVSKLRNKRVAMFSETTPSDVLNDAKLKSLSGDGNSSLKLVIQSNYQPQFENLDSAICDRLVFVPFEARFELNPSRPGVFKKDRDFIDNLKTVYLSEVSEICRSILCC